MNDFNLESLKTGMIVKVRNGELYRVMLGTSKGNLLVNSKGCVELFGGILWHSGMNGYNYDLTYKTHPCESKEIHQIHEKFDIVAVYDNDDGLWGLTTFNLKHCKLVWAR